jgi:predicted DNA-binding protein (UPF0251 family)
MVNSAPLSATMPLIMPKLELDARWLTPDRAADLLGVARPTFFKMLKRGALGKVNRRELHARAVFYWQPDLERYLREMGGPPSED